jgi:predicted dehydrogenase
MKQLLIISFLFMSVINTLGQKVENPLRIGVAGLTHTHVHWLLGEANKPDFEIVGIAEPNRELAERYFKQYNLPLTLLFSSLDEMLAKAKPEAVTAFNSVYEHLEVVKACAPKKVHVMVEKPLAVSLDHAKQMESLAKQHGIYLLTNYETTWYPSNYKTFSLVHDEHAIGEVRKIVVHDGHKGPKEIGVNQEFLDWLTDPKLNGGGALMDFGCYGANQITWLMKGERPQSVFALTQQFKPEVYPKVDDEATILVTYPKTQGIIQASWNWPYNRKDIEVYGQTGLLKGDKTSLVLKIGDNAEQPQALVNATTPFDSPFSYFAAVIRGTIKMNDSDLSALPLNMTAMEILDAAQRSAQSGERVYLKK